MRDIDAEAGDAAIEPEAEDPLELRPHLRVPPIQIRLPGREIVQVVAPALLVERPCRPAAEDRLPVVRDLVGPDVEVGALAKPGMADRGVVRHEVEKDADSARFGLRDQPVEVVERSEVGVDPGVVGHVVAPVDVGRRMDRVEPDRVDAEPLEVLEPAGHSGEVADPVVVRVRKGARIDLVQHGVSPPAVGHGATTLAPCRQRRPRAILPAWISKR